MRFAFLSMHLPERRGDAAGRALRALVDGLVATGHDVSVASWTARASREPMPVWFRRVGLSDVGKLRSKAHALRRPRNLAARVFWVPPDGAIPVAHEYTAFPAIRSMRPSVLLEHHILRLDLLASRRLSPSHVQSLRAQAQALRSAPLVIATSSRVAEAMGRAASVCPLPYPEGEVLPDPGRPVAGVVANWRWPPNAVALRRLLRFWPDVRAQVPAARLVLAGSGSEEIGASDGVSGLGPVQDSANVLASCAVVPFPCPASTGPKIKVFEALSHGRAVVTSRAGVEGLLVEPGLAASLVADAGSFRARLVGVLTDEGHRGAVAAAGRLAIQAHHAPEVVARTWVELAHVAAD